MTVFDRFALRFELVRGSQEPPEAATVPALAGAYVFAEYCRGRLQVFIPRNGGAREARLMGPRVDALASLGEDARGELYVLSLAGTVSRIVA